MEFNYQAKNSTGKILEGVVEAPDESSAIGVLHSKGLVVFSLYELHRDLLKGDLNMAFSRVKGKDIVVFTRQLATLVAADMPIG